jgi:acetyl esterase/lipase
VARREDVKDMMHLPGFLSRNALAPSLRLMRDRLAAKPDQAELRKWGARFDRAYPRTPAGARTTDVVIGDCKATWIDVRRARKGRVILYLHGGAFIMETPGMHSALLARIAAEVRARALMPHYRLAPEHPYPAAIDDCMAAYRHLLGNDFTAADIAIIGDSAGGNLTLALLLRIRDEGLPLPACAVVMSPVTDATFGGDSIRRNDGHDAMFAPIVFRAMAPLYLPDAKLKTNPYVSPLFGKLGGLPPILMLVGSTELLLDDSVRFASKCPSATLEVWHGMPHIFPAFDFLPEAVDATKRIGVFVRNGFAAARASVDEDDSVADSLASPDESVGSLAARPSPDRSARPASGVPPLAWVYFGLALLLALGSVVPGLSTPGAPSAGMLAVLLPGSPSGHVSLDALLGMIVVGLFGVTSLAKIGWRRVVPIVAATVMFGAGCGLALLLFERER